MRSGHPFTGKGRFERPFSFATSGLFGAFTALARPSTPASPSSSLPLATAIPLGFWSDIPQVRAALAVNVLFLSGVALAVALWWAFATRRSA